MVDGGSANKFNRLAEMWSAERGSRMISRTILRRIAKSPCHIEGSKVIVTATRAVVMQGDLRRVYAGGCVEIVGGRYLVLNAAGEKFLATPPTIPDVTLARVLGILQENPRAILAGNVLCDRSMLPLGPRRSTLETMEELGYVEILPDAGVALTEKGQDAHCVLSADQVLMKVSAAERALIESLRSGKLPRFD